MSTRPRSTLWFRDPFPLAELKAECLRGYSFTLVYEPPWTPYGFPVIPESRVWCASLPAGRARFKGGTFQLDATIRGCEPGVMGTFGWPWPWPFEVRAGKQTVAVCLDYEAASGAVDDWRRSS